MSARCNECGEVPPCHASDCTRRPIFTYEAFKHARHWLVINLDTGEYTGGERQPHQFRSRRQARRWIHVLSEIDRRRRRRA